MLQHQNARPTLPERVVILGSHGFVGQAAANRLHADGINVLQLGRTDLDLTAENAHATLGDILQPNDVLLFISAKAPCRDHAQLVENVRMGAHVSEALRAVAPAQVVYISSDAVYRDSPAPLDESSCAEPASLHGVMHIARELMLKSVFGGPLAILRPSLLYGAADPHNGYGPNQFRPLAAEGKPIVLFGEGEERRDHVLIDDVGELINRVIINRSDGILNVVTGAVASFREIAEMVTAHFDTAPEILTTPRKGPMPHDGYRPFDPAAMRVAFPDFRPTQLEAGLARTHERAAE